ncbi:hypothetical protein GGF43_006015 [Coemansia sp. RSA 2618]|nr:hypothetical protein GGF43_006015 [Coemansia sp. RSA 2618]
MRSVLFLSLAVLAVAAHAAPAPEPYLGLLPLGETKIADLDSEDNCLSATAKAISAADRSSLNSTATTLQLSLFRDIRQFAPAALALGQKKIQEDILSDDYSAAMAALHQLRDYFETNIPEVVDTASEASSSASSSTAACDSPTAKNLRIIYESLIKIVQ